MKISPLAPKNFPSMPPVAGVRLAAVNCGIKYKTRTDLMLAELSEESKVAGVFTQSKTASANIVWGKEILSHHSARVVIVNSGNANAFNGVCGKESIDRIVKQSAKIFDCKDYEIYPCSTGVIGEPLKDELITNKLHELKENLSKDNWQAAAQAIMTTDTFPKAATKTITIENKNVTINGIAKGSGMIAPDMATLLAYIFTDANISADVLQSLLKEVTDKTFNAITVDSDTSTSDTTLLCATGKANHNEIKDINTAELSKFKDALYEVMKDLAHQIVKDGEGANKFITVNVSGAENNKAAKTIALAIGNSPLVKTAIAGEDANWGRVIMAVGKAGEAADRDKISVTIGQTNIVKNGQLNPDYKEIEVTQHMQGQYIDVTVDVGISNGNATIWTCDFTKEYIAINADYRS